MIPLVASASLLPKGLQYRNPALGVDVQVTAENNSGKIVGVAKAFDVRTLSFLPISVINMTNVAHPCNATG